MNKKLHGVLVALVTPMKANSEIDFNTYTKHVAAMIAAGVHGLIPLGSTGEFYALTAEERRAVLKAMREAPGGRVPVLASTNAGSTRDVIAFTREAEALGCDGVMLVGRKTGIGIYTAALLSALHSIAPQHDYIEVQRGANKHMRLDRRLRWQQFEVPRRAGAPVAPTCCMCPASMRRAGGRALSS